MSLEFIPSMTIELGGLHGLSFFIVAIQKDVSFTIMALLVRFLWLLRFERGCSSG